uniref:NADH-ubiquinone oxidoreductase chain 6 n=1 Tax=Brasilocerus sp. 2 DTA-2012 TaxID=1176494 RepID=A0A0H3UL66_9COLE|nr:NADH dehydrogenase subunit 6 [Brasilocerus sp. 2 DTA-2012]
MKMMITMMIFMTGMIMLTKHPLMVSMIIIIQTILIAMTTNLFSESSWYSYTLFMVMIGGMMVMFIYMTSLTSNKKIYFNKTLIFTWMMLTSTIYWLIEKEMLISKKLTMTNMQINEMNMKLETAMSKFINYPLSMLMISLMIYLFITMTASIKITWKNSGPIRQK